MEIYLVRHGETPWNEHRLLQGRSDIELNENGRQAALKTGKELENISFDRIYSSPLKRAYETACLIRGERSIPIVTDERLREIGFGVNEGKDSKALFQNEADPFHYFFIAPELYEPVEEGEPFVKVLSRTREFMQQVIEPLEKTCRRVMIAGHGAMNKSIEAYMFGREIKDYWEGGLQANCSVFVTKYEAGSYEIVQSGERISAVKKYQ